MPRHKIGSKRVGWALASIIVVAVFGFVGVNVVGYLGFQRAWHVGDRLTADELRGIAIACTAIEPPSGTQRFAGDQIPAPFRKLQARSAAFFPGSSDFLLYGVGDMDVSLRISTSKQDQQICVFTDFFVPQGRVVLWHKNPAFAERRNPSGRIVTVSEYFRDHGRDWIVLPGEIRVIDRDYSVGSADTVVASVPLSDSGRERIAGAIAAIPGELHGREYTSGGSGGVRLHVCFSPNGDQGAGDIHLANTWREEVAPLIDSISSCLPQKDAVTFKSVVTQQPYFDPNEQVSRTLADIDAMERRLAGRAMHLPWWCVWPRFVLQ